MRTTNEIKIGDKALSDILAAHKAWISDETCGELAYLHGANLRGADLRGIDLRGIDLRGADLRGIDLRGADLSGIDLRGADLRGADLRGAYLSRAKGILAIGPGGSRGDMLYAVRHENCVMVKAGCFWGTLAEFAAKVAETHGDNEHGKYYRAAIAMIEVWSECYE